MKKDKDILEEALGHLRTMRDTWKEVMAKTANGKQYQDKGTGSVMPAGDSTARYIYCNYAAEPEKKGTGSGW